MDTIALVKELRAMTDCGFADCKSAVLAASGDLTEAVKILRKMGKVSADRKVGRATSNGIVGYKVHDGRIYLVHINCETDFVARSESMNNLLSSIFDTAIKNKLKLSDELLQLNEIKLSLESAIMATGENIVLSKVSSIDVSDQSTAYGCYIHNKINDNYGQIVSVVLMHVSDPAKREIANDVAKKIAMHVVATNPLCLSIDDVESNVIDAQKEIFFAQAKSTGKPDNVLSKIVDGKLSKFYEGVVLLEQSFVMDDKLKIKDFVNSCAKESNIQMHIQEYLLIKVS